MLILLTHSRCVHDWARLTSGRAVKCSQDVIVSSRELVCAESSVCSLDGRLLSGLATSETHETWITVLPAEGHHISILLHK